MIDVIGTKEVLQSIKYFESGNEHDLEQLLFFMANNTRSYAIKIIQGGSRSGRLYKRRSVTHRASSAGEPPKTDTGNLINNITVEKEGRLHYTAGSRKGAPYGRYLEYGTMNMQPRPWLIKSYRNTMVKYNGRFV